VSEETTTSVIRSHLHFDDHATRVGLWEQCGFFLFLTYRALCECAFISRLSLEGPRRPVPSSTPTHTKLL